MVRRMAYKRTTMETRTRVVGQREPITAQLLDQLEQPVNLTGLTITIEAVNVETGTVKFTAAATISDAVLGKVGYVPIATDVDTAGLHAIYWIDNQNPPRRFPHDGARQLVNIVDKKSSG